MEWSRTAAPTFALLAVAADGWLVSAFTVLACLALLPVPKPSAAAEGAC